MIRSAIRMPSKPSRGISNRLLVLAIGLLIAANLAVAANAHMLCDLFCIHGGMEIPNDICSGRTSP